MPLFLKFPGINKQAMKDYRAALVTARVNYYPICAFLTALPDYHDIWLIWCVRRAWNHEGVLEVGGHDGHIWSWWSWWSWLIQIRINNDTYFQSLWGVWPGGHWNRQPLRRFWMYRHAELRRYHLQRTYPERETQSILLLRNLLLGYFWTFIISSLTSLQNNLQKLVSCKLLDLGCKMQASIMLHLRRAIGTQALAMALLSCTQGVNCARFAMRCLCLWPIGTGPVL